VPSPFCQIGLVDANSIDPEGSWLGGIAQMAKSPYEVLLYQHSGGKRISSVQLRSCPTGSFDMRLNDEVLQRRAGTPAIRQGFELGLIAVQPERLSRHLELLFV